MKEVILSVDFGIKCPVISGSTDPGEFGIDLSFAKTQDRRCLLPKTHVKGRLRESLVMLSSVLGLSQEDLQYWLGSESKSDTHNRPQRGLVLFDDFILEENPSEGFITKIKMDKERGAVKKGAYIVIEKPFSSGKIVHFSGKIRFTCSSEQDKANIQNPLEKGLRWIPALGGQRSIGFGRIQSVSIHEESKDAPNDIDSHPACSSLQLQLKPLSGFCLAKPKKAQNIFESETIISGAALKGSIANTLNYLLGRDLHMPLDENIPSPWKELGTFFSRIRFEHAFPSKSHDRPIQPPLSLVSVPGGSQAYDVILCERPGLIDHKAPVFQADWKDDVRRAVYPRFGWEGTPQKRVKVRTQIDGSKRRARKGQLFSLETVTPDEFIWHGRVDLTQVPAESRAQVRSQLQAIFSFGLHYLGKTKADVNVEVDALQGQNLEVAGPIQGKFWVLTMQTPALILKPEASLNQALQQPKILFDAYDSFFKEISNNYFKMKRFFAAERLLGGYLHQRFQHGKPYNPFLITTAGSVFLLEATEMSDLTTHKEQLRKWLTHGLPMPQWAKEEYGEYWQTNPFVTENGFGEIALNLFCHEDWKPSAFTEA